MKKTSPGAYIVPMLTVPNLLTVFRLLALPVTIVLFRRQYFVASALVFAVAMITDCFDGWIARRLKQETRLGLYLDPVVDKIVIVTMLYELAHGGLFPFAVPHLFLARELLQNAVRAAAAVGGRVVGANWMGKTKAVSQSILVTAGLALPSLSDRLAPPCYEQLDHALGALAWALVAMTWVFFGVFVAWNRDALRGDDDSMIR